MKTNFSNLADLFSMVANISEFFSFDSNDNSSNSQVDNQQISSFQASVNGMNSYGYPIDLSKGLGGLFGKL